MSKVTVKQFLDAGFEFVIWDCIRKIGDNDLFECGDCSDARGFNHPSKIDNEYEVVSLAWRKNTGTQPVGDDCPVVVKVRCGDELEAISGNSPKNGRLYVDWEIDGSFQDCLEWKPDLEAIAQLDQSHEWKNGDEIEFKKKFEDEKLFCNGTVVGYMKCSQGCDWLVFSDKYDCLHQHHVKNGAYDIRKPESPEAKAIKSLTSELWGKKLTANAHQVAELIIGLGYRKQSDK